MDPAAALALRRLLDETGLDPAFGGSVEITGEEPVAPSRHRLGAATAAAVAAQAIGIATIWRMRSGRTQNVRVDLRRAVIPGLTPRKFLLQNGHRLGGGGRVPGTDFFRTKDDRYIYVTHPIDYPDLFVRVLEFFACSNAHDAIARAVACWKAEELEDAMAERKLVGVIARSRDEWLAHPQGRWLAERPTVEILKIAEGEPLPFGAAARPLSGIRVLDFGHVLAGPTAARTLAEQGADVLRVSPPHEPDPPLTSLDSSHGKRCAFIDLELPDDVACARRLSSEADVVAQSWRPASLERRGFGPADVAARSRGMVYLSVSCYGDGGPWRERGGYDPIGQVASGLALDEGAPGIPRLVPTFTLNDYLAAYLGAAGVLSALVRRAREGGSYHVRVSLTGTSMYVQQLGLQTPPEGMTLPRIGPGETTRARTAWGELEFVAPLAEYSETQAFWELPVEPLGASPPVWRAVRDAARTEIASAH